VKNLNSEQLEYSVQSNLSGIGISKVVNAYGPATILGGSVLDDRVVKAMGEISRYYVDMDDLLDKVNSKIAKILGVEAAHVTSGAGAGLALSAAACMTGTDQSKIEKLPDVAELKRNEIIIQTGHRNTYERCLRVSGGKLVSVGIPYLTYPWQLRNAITEKTAAISHFALGTARPGVLGLEAISSVASEFSIPVIVDACNEVLPDLGAVANNISRGADLLVLSGGKNIQGPNDTGIVCGRKEIVEACRANSYPHMNGIGRVMKVSKEQIVGLLVALQVYSESDPVVRLNKWVAKLDAIRRELSEIPNIKIELVPERPSLSSVPLLEIHLDEPAIGATSLELVAALKSHDPPIVLDIDYWKNFRKETIFVNPSCLQDSEELIVARALKLAISDKNFLRNLLSRKSTVKALAYP
jgi:uncharacterized pyridoxal phosphate-dependent enzyme